MDILDRIRNTTAASLDTITGDFSDLPRGHFRAAKATGMVRIVEGADDLVHPNAGRSAARPGMITIPNIRVVDSVTGDDGSWEDHNGDRCNNPKCCPSDGPTDVRSPRQVELMDSLVAQLGELDHQVSLDAHNYTNKMTLAGKWTPGREGNASDWIGRMIKKVRELKARPVQAVAQETDKPAFDDFADVTDGNYAIVRDGKTHFYRVSRKVGKGQYAGRTFVNLQERASESLFRVEGPWPVRKAILNAIREAGITESHLLYSSALSRCWHCHTTLTDDRDNPYHAHGLGPVCGPKVMG